MCVYIYIYIYILQGDIPDFLRDDDDARPKVETDLGATSLMNAKYGKRDGYVCMCMCMCMYMCMCMCMCMFMCMCMCMCMCMYVYIYLYIYIYILCLLNTYIDRSNAYIDRT